MLCGGAGTRFESCNPKPMNLINGIPMIYYTINQLGMKRLYIIYNKSLDRVGFTEYLVSTFKDVDFTFVKVDFQTRGPAETLLVGLKGISSSEQLLVLDNDNMYVGIGENMPEGNFIIYSDISTKLTHYSFITLDNQKNVSCIRERDPISAHVCMGGYGFKDVETCKKYCKELVLNTIGEETYMSKVFELMLKKGENVSSYFLPDSYSIGTPADILQNMARIPRKPLTIGVNTRTNTEDVLRFIQFLKDDGHIISSSQLDEDLFIDNSTDICKLGFYEFDSKRNDFRTNIYNRIVRKDKYTITKYGNIQGELFFYKTVADAKISRLFPCLKGQGTNCIDLEYINGTGIANLYVEGLLNNLLIRKIIDSATVIHQADIEDGVEITEEDMFLHYKNKFEERVKHTECYPFEDAERVHGIIREMIPQFKEPISKVIHGDMWFSNIMIYQNGLKFFDMRGKVNDKYTIKGHRMYDWAKLYQSFLGLDCILEQRREIDPNIRDEAVRFFWDYLQEKGLVSEGDKDKIIHLCGYLIHGTFFFYDSTVDLTQKNMIWELVKRCLSYSR